jgi:hypothetical protein
MAPKPRRQLANYQPARSGLMVWLDDLAYDESRIGRE